MDPKEPTLEERVNIMDKSIRFFIDELNKELTAMKETILDISFRLDTLNRYSIANGDKNYDDVLKSLENFKEHQSIIIKAKELKAIKEKINFVLEANKTLQYKIYADDLNLIKQIEDFGGVLPEIALLIKQLPSSEKFSNYLQKYLPASNDKDNS